MNKYAAHGLADAARSGRRILVVVGRVREALEEFRPMVPDARVRLAAGAERIDFSSLGTIRFSTPGSGREGV